MIEPETVLIEGGLIVLGLPECPSEASVTHVWSRKEVDVPPFRIGRYPVTVEEYLAFTGSIRVELRRPTERRYRDSQ